MKRPQSAPSLRQAIAELSKADRLESVLRLGIGPAPDGKYRHWDTLRHIPPPDGITSSEWWAAIKLARITQRRQLALVDEFDTPFTFTTPDPVLEMLHAIDRDASGAISSQEAITNKQTRDRYVQSSIIEEAITSSQLEGAATTRQKAKQMIRSGRQPVDRGELMIFNNYQALQLVSRFKDQPLTPELVSSIHLALTKGTMDDASPPYFRTPGDGIAVYGEGNTLLHKPPPAGQIPKRLKILCDFANDPKLPGFLHPVLKAIVLHFWLAYDHPFVDGNGRTARALFYWSMLRDGFWLTEYISISRVFYQAQASYGRAFLYTETDENDLTYFILYHLKVVVRAISELHDYLAKKTAEIQRTERLVRASIALNHRQVALLTEALRHPGQRYTIESHKVKHRVTYQTARTDLLGLESKELFQKVKSGRTFVFYPVDNLNERLERPHDTV